MLLNCNEKTPLYSGVFTALHTMPIDKIELATRINIDSQRLSARISIRVCSYNYIGYDIICTEGGIMFTKCHIVYFRIFWM